MKANYQPSRLQEAIAAARVLQEANTGQGFLTLAEVEAKGAAV